MSHKMTTIAAGVNREVASGGAQVCYVRERLEEDRSGDRARQSEGKRNGDQAGLGSSGAHLARRPRLHLSRERR